MIANLTRQLNMLDCICQAVAKTQQDRTIESCSLLMRAASPVRCDSLSNTSKMSALAQLQVLLCHGVCSIAVVIHIMLGAECLCNTDSEVNMHDWQIGWNQTAPAAQPKLKCQANVVTASSAEPAIPAW